MKNRRGMEGWESTSELMENVLYEEVKESNLTAFKSVLFHLLGAFESRNYFKFTLPKLLVTFCLNSKECVLDHILWFFLKL